MKEVLLLLFTLLYSIASAQITLESWKFQTGDNPEWTNPNFDDSDWATIKANILYENQGYEYNGYSWYRVHFDLPSSLREASHLKDSLRIFLGRVDDIDETFLNGERIGGIGTFPNPDGSGAVGYYDKIRRYVLPWDHPAIRWDKKNVIAVRVYDGGGGGGLWGGMPSVGMVDLIDFVEMQIDATPFRAISDQRYYTKQVKMANAGLENLEGVVQLELIDRKGIPIDTIRSEVNVSANEVQLVDFQFPKIDNVKASFTFREKRTGKAISDFMYTPFILTPEEGVHPFITNPDVYGVRPGRVFQMKINALGERPMTFSSNNLPEGLTLDPMTGIIRGCLQKKRKYQLNVAAQNRHGYLSTYISIIVGDQIALTPPMGWNSWNVWGMTVSDEIVKQSANAMVFNRLANHGYNYIVIDDGWQGPRDESGELTTNEKFPDMQALGQHIHDLGLKFGIYSSPGEISCGGLAGSLGHELQDVKTWADWGVDYIKYDWCSYSGYLLDEYGRDQTTWTIEDQVYPFRQIADAIDSTDRDMVLSVANWGMNRAWEWADQTGGQLWRTTGDIEDNWASLSSIGFSQEEPGKYSGPGGWSDPDMLVVGRLGWGESQRQSRLTPVEQYTHMSLWALLSAPLMIGCNLNAIDDFTYNLLANYRVIAINQDPLGQAAQITYEADDVMVWVKPLQDGSKAVGIFNLADEDRQIVIPWSDMGLYSVTDGYDAWTHKPYRVADRFDEVVFGHGVRLVVLP
ncbi:MAG: glycoside hydrolase family 27 protein [Bacteroidota bacterium]